MCDLNEVKGMDDIMNNICEEISKRLSILRKEHDLSQDALANKLNIDKRKVSRWECNVSAPDVYDLLKLSEIFNVSVDYLVGNTTIKKKYPQKKKTILNIFQR